MSDQENPEQKFALGLVALIVAAIVASVIALGAWKARPHPAGASTAPAAATATPAATAAATTDGVERIYFELGQDQLPADAAEVLSRVATAARANAGAVVSVSGFHDASGNAASNEDLAKRRAQAVQHALEANGVSGSQIKLNKPALTTGGTDAKEARRVELRVE
jgi:outer membrane protein OmpA-like peptidoglycan-associated protein